MRAWFMKALRNAPKFARVFGFMVCVYAVAMFFAARSAKAEVDEILLGLGAEMMHHPGATEGNNQTLRINGATLQVRASQIDEPMGDVLDYFEVRCQARDGQTAAQLEELIADAPSPLADLDTSMVDATERYESSHRGFVACLDQGEERADHESLMLKIQSYLDTGNISDIGHMRYVYAERISDDESYFITIHSDSDLNVFEMFPSDGDAPGRDVEGIPRPPDSNRILSSWVEGEPYAMNLYTSSERTPEEFVAHFREVLPAEGWAPVESTPNETVSIDGMIILTYSLGERLTTIHINPDEGGAAATVLTSDREP